MTRVWAPALRGASILGAMILVLTPVGVSTDVIERVMALVGGLPILDSDVRAARSLRFVDVGEGPDADRQVVRRLIDRRLMLSEVDRYAPTEPSRAAVDQAVQHVRERFDSGQAFEAALGGAGLSEAHVRGRVREDLRIAAYLEQRFVVPLPTEDEILSYYRDRTGRFMAGGQLMPLETVRDQIIDELAAVDRQARVEAWVASLRERTAVIEMGN